MNRLALTESPARRRRTAALRRGFTLIEMVLVLAIIALLMGVSIKLLTGVRKTGELTRVRADISAIGSALDLYRSNTYALPTTEQGLGALVNKPTTAPIPRGWIQQMKSEPVDPWNNKYQYRRPAQRNTGGEYDLFSAGPDMTPDTEDDIGNWEDL